MNQRATLAHGGTSLGASLYNDPVSVGPAPVEGRDISALFGVTRRRGWIVLLCAVLAAGPAYAYSKKQTPTYAASARLLLRDPVPGAGNLLFGTPIPQTAQDREAQALAGPIKARAIKVLAPKLGGRAAAAAAVAGADAASAPESDVVEIKAVAAAADRAALFANVIAEQNIAYRKARSLARIGRARRAAQRELLKLGPPGTDPQKLAAVGQLRTTLQALNQVAGVQEGDAEILQRAVASASPVSPKPGRAGLIGAFAGVLIGFAVALVREQLDRRLRGSKDLGFLFGGIYRYEGRVTPVSFLATYDSSYDTGRFEMRRPARESSARPQAGD